MLLLLGSVYLLLKSTESWGSIGTDSTDMGLKADLHGWLEGQGFQPVTPPGSLVDSFSDDWKDRIESPFFASATIDGELLHVVTWTGNHSGRKYWKVIIYWRAIVNDFEWLPGAATGRDTAIKVFEDMRGFITKAREKHPVGSVPEGQDSPEKEVN